MLKCLLLSWKEWKDYGNGYSTHAAMEKARKRQSSLPSVPDSISNSLIISS
jgi:hypothetical protein